MSASDIASVLGILVSLLASYLPGFSDWFANLESTYKRLFMLAGGLVIVGGAFGLSCAGVLAYFACTLGGAVEAVKVFIAFMIANQATYVLARRPSL